MINIHVVIVAYALDIRPLVTALDGADTYFHIFIHSRRPEANEICWWMSADHPNISLHDYGVNRGLSTSWNDGIIEAQAAGADAIVVVNDDVLMARADLLILAGAAIAHPDCGIVVCEGYDLMWREFRNLNFVVFAVNPLALDRAGYFDQNCSPYCFEDSDLAHRLALCGVPFHNAGPTNITHLGSQSQTVPELKVQNQVTFAATAAYYRRKWGGLPGNETYTLPFNDTRFGWQIAASQRHDPYPGYGRGDLQEIVRL